MPPVTTRPAHPSPLSRQVTTPRRFQFDTFCSPCFPATLFLFRNATRRLCPNPDLYPSLTPLACCLRPLLHEYASRATTPDTRYAIAMMISICSENNTISAPTNAITATSWNGWRLPKVISFALQKRQLLTIRKLVTSSRHNHTSAILGSLIGEPLW